MAAEVKVAMLDLTGRCSPEAVTTTSPACTVSTGTSPRGVRISVPAAKQGTGVRVLWTTVLYTWPGNVTRLRPVPVVRALGVGPVQVSFKAWVPLPDVSVNTSVGPVPTPVRVKLVKVPPGTPVKSRAPVAEGAEVFTTRVPVSAPVLWPPPLSVIVTFVKVISTIAM
jgi:hypothetical protein